MAGDRFVNLELDYLERTVAKGREYFYYRRAGLRTPIKSPEGTRLTPSDSGFLAAYDKIHQHAERRVAAAVDSDLPGPGTLAALIAQYYDSRHYRDELSPRTRSDYRRHMDILSSIQGCQLMREMTTESVIEIQDNYADTPRKANYLVQCLSILAGFAQLRPSIYGLRYNPAAPVRMLKRGPGFPPWPDTLIEKFRETAHPELVWAMEMALWTGQRGQDLVRMAWADYRDGAIAVRQEKGGEKIWIPAHSSLKTVLAGIKKRGTVILTTRTGRAWRSSNLSHQVKAAVSDCGFEGYTPHGLRKNATNSLFEAGCSSREVKAITGHRTLQMLELYGAEAQTKVLAKSAITRLEAYTAQRERNKNGSTAADDCQTVLESVPNRPKQERDGGC